MIQFDKATHKYTLDGKELISVTQLMRKHSLSPDYSMVNSEVLQAKAERGTIIHEEIEDYIKNGNVGFSKELRSFIEWSENAGISVFESETILHNDIVAGTCDLMFESDGVHYIADFKTTSTLHMEAVSWQLSIYNYLNGWEADMGQAFHFQKDGSLNIVEIPLKPKEEIERLMECERKGEPFEPTRLNLMSPEQELALRRATSDIETAKEQIRQAEERAEAIKQAILDAMEENGVKKYETEWFSITYVAPIERETLDSARLKKELPDIAKQYTKKNITKASVRITLKTKEEEE